MRWLKRDMWKAGIALAGLLLFLVLMVWITMSVDAYTGTSRLAAAGPVQATPTVDVTATMTSLNEEKLRQEIQQLKNQNEPDLPGWIRMNATILASTLVVVIGGLIGLFRWFGDRRAEREKRAEERFQTIVLGLGSKDRETKINSAIMLRTFLQPGYGQFYRQAFELSVAHLRLRKANSTQSEQPSVPNLPLIVVSGKPLPQEPNLPDSLSQALINVFKISFPLAREQADKAMLKAVNSSPLFALRITLLKLLKRPPSLLESELMAGARMYYIPQRLDATNIQLDDASLFGADLAEATLAKASLQRADLFLADLSNADLRGADLSRAYLGEADLSEADLREANLSGVRYLEDVRSLDYTDLRGVKGLSKEQLAACKAKGAIIDEDSTASPPQPTVSPSSPSQSINIQAPSTPSAQGSLSTLDTNGSSASISQQSDDAQTLSATPAQESTPPPSTDGSSSASSQPNTEP